VATKCPERNFYKKAKSITKEKEVRRMKDSKKMEPLIEWAERIKTDQTLPRGLARNLLVVNRGLIKEVRKYNKALEILEGRKKLLKKVNNKEITMEQYKKIIRYARQQSEGFKIFIQEIFRIFKEKGFETFVQDSSKILKEKGIEITL
jgi:hypothetical protein